MACEFEAETAMLASYPQFCAQAPLLITGLPRGWLATTGSHDDRHVL